MRGYDSKRILSVILLTVLCCACVPTHRTILNDLFMTKTSLSSVENQASAPESQFTETVVSLETPSPKLTEIFTTQVPVFSETSLTHNGLVKEEIVVETDFSKMDLSGRVVLEGMSVLDLTDQVSFPMQDPSFIWDFDTNQKWTLSIAENQAIAGFAISPDYLTLAYWIMPYSSDSVEPNILRIVDNSGKLLSETNHSNRDWFSLIGWYNERYVMFDKVTFTEDHHQALPWPVVVYDPFTDNVVMELSVSRRAGVQSIPSYPWDSNAFTSAVYSPDFRYVVIVNNVYNLVLWDIRNDSAIHESAPNTYEFGPPAWSADGRFFITDKRVDPELSGGKEQEELFQIDLQGKEEQLTYFSDYFAETRIAGFSLSPDERYIAFNLSNEMTSHDYKLALFDKEKREIRIYSNLVSYHFSAYVPYHRPVWSPDSNQIMMVISTEEGKGYRTVLIDLEENYAVELAENVKPIGWMISE